jgi:SAM-dependent methyltransferase
LRVLLKIIRKIQNYVQTGELLEVGCGRGDFLKVAQMNGFSAIGCDIFGGQMPSSEGISFYDGTLKDAKFPDGHFNVVVVRNILEHLFNPNVEINEIRRILKINGYLYLKVPNVTFEYGLKCQLFFGKKHSFDPPYHLNYFSKTSLKKFLQNAKIEFLCWYLEQPTLGSKWTSNLLRQIGYRLFQTISFLSREKISPGPLLSCIAQKLR